MIDIDVVHLEHLPEDLQSEAEGFVLSSWKASFWHFRPRMVESHTYNIRQRELAKRLMDEETLLVATMAGAPDLFLGWACTSDDRETVHYVYVKQSWRRMGIARRLIDGVLTCTHQPTHSHVREWCARLGVVYDPYQLMR